MSSSFVGMKKTGCQGVNPWHVSCKLATGTRNELPNPWLVNSCTPTLPQTMRSSHDFGMNRKVLQKLMLSSESFGGNPGNPRPGVCKKGETFQTSSCRNPPMYSDIWPPALTPTYFGRFAVSFWIVFTLVGGKKTGPFDPMMLLQSLGSLA